MNDDLISRKAVLHKLGLLDDKKNGNEYFFFGVDTAREIIENEPIAYDKEKVKIQIKNKVGIGMCQEKDCKKYNNDCDACRAETAIEIVEKGGIE